MYSFVVNIYDDIFGYILAGGASSRMGWPKSELMLGGKSLAERAVSTMSALTGERVTIVGSNFSSEFFGVEVKVVSDNTRALKLRDDNGRAPIIGLYTALTDADNEWIAVLAVDLPFVSGELLSRLASMRHEETDAVVPVQPDGRLQPLCALYRREVCLAAARIAIEASELSLHKLLSELRLRRVEPSGLNDLQNAANFFLNVNTPEDLERAKQITES